MEWKDINIRKGKELYFLDTDNFYKNNDIEKLTQQLCIIFDKDVEWVESLPLTDVFKYKTELSFLAEPPKGDFEKIVTIDNIEYHFIDLNELTLGEFIDLESNLNNAIENLEKIIAILYRPVNEKYDIKSAKLREKIFLDKFQYETAAGVALFFSLLGMDFIQHTKDYSMLDKVMIEIMKMRDKMKDLQLGAVKTNPKKKQKKSSSGL